MRHWIGWLVFLVVLVGAAGVATAWYMYNKEDKRPTLRTEAVTRGDLRVTISATGTVEPEEVVDVGAQVAGQILSFGTDANGKPVDYRSVVNEGTVLARIDDSLYRADEEQAKAQLQQAQASVAETHATVEQAQAGVELAQANLKQSQAKLFQAQRDWARAQKLGPSEALSQANYDAYESAYEVAVANVAVSQASLLQSHGTLSQDKAAVEAAQASVASAKAACFRADRNLGYCIIKSPVKGVIIDRRVNIGQTVVSSLNAPSLFLIAKDLRRMQVWVSVNEADIDHIHAGQPVTFTVDAIPGETFTGKVGKVRYNATMTQNVVTYTVEVQTDNSSLKLLPYLTANVQFELNHLHNVLLVPNAALRWHPPQESMVAPEYRATSADESNGGHGANGQAGAGGQHGERGGSNGHGEEAAHGHKAKPASHESPTSRAAGRAPASQPAQGKSGASVTTPGTLWVRQGQYVRPIDVQVGPSDGSLSEVQGEGVHKGLQVVVGEQRQSEGQAAGTSNPFTPHFHRPRPQTHK